MSLTQQAADPLARQLLAQAALPAVCDHALQSYPHECCGMILASGVVRACVNAQEELRRIQLSAFDRGAESAFVFAAEDQFFLANSARTEDPVAIIYHSHPTGSVAFSALDVAGATWEGGPTYPQIDHLLIHCPHGKIDSAALYRLDQMHPVVIKKWGLVGA
jgi:adenylyltransferase/sulfurtransferase